MAVIRAVLARAQRQGQVVSAQHVVEELLSRDCTGGQILREALRGQKVVGEDTDGSSEMGGRATEIEDAAASAAGDPVLGPLLEKATSWARALSHSYVGTEHLAMALADDDALAASLFGAQRARVRDRVLLHLALYCPSAKTDQNHSAEVWGEALHNVWFPPELARCEDALLVREVHSILDPSSLAALPHVQAAVRQGPKSAKELARLMGEWAIRLYGIGRTQDGSC